MNEFGNLGEIMHDVMHRLIAGKPLGWYDPGNYDSPIEDIFAYRCERYLRDDVQMLTQYKVKTYTGNYRLDFVLVDENTGLKIGIECDGKAFHKDIKRDLIRDVSIVASSDIDAIYRITGTDLYYRDSECICTIAQRHPELFRAQVNSISNMHSTMTYTYTPISLVCDMSNYVEGTGYDPYYDDEPERRSVIQIRHVSKCEIASGSYIDELNALDLFKIAV